eukprot:1841072-Ditylum_brightwellii.AAC.1
MSSLQHNTGVGTNGNNKYNKIKKNMDAITKNYTNASNQINSSLAQDVKTRKDNKQTLCKIVKETLEKELKAMLPEIIETSSNEEDVSSKIQHGAENDMLEQNKPDRQQAMTNNDNDKEDSNETEKEKINQESNNDDEEEDSSGDDSSSSSLDEGEIITQEDNCKKPKTTMMSIKAMT